jgi:molybdopterin-containing oxidoreductase family membrane subunit
MRDLEQKVLAPLNQTGRQFMIIVMGFIILIAIMVYSWFYQIVNGLTVTGLSQPVPWGIYILNFIFFISISIAGTLISGILRLLKQDWANPITRIAEMVTIISVIIAFLNIMFDIGRPQRLFNMFFYGNSTSPFVWDTIVIVIYLLASAAYLYFPMVPDLARLAPKVPRMKFFYRLLSNGYKGTEEQKKELHRMILTLAIMVTATVVMVHTVLSWVFGLMKAQPSWNDAIMGPYFISGALITGLPILIIIAAIFRKAYGLEKYFKLEMFDKLGKLLLVLALIYMYLFVAETLTKDYAAKATTHATSEALWLGEFAWITWTMVIVGFLVPMLILTFKRTRTYKGILLASGIMFVAMWVKRFIIVVPGLTRYLLPYQDGIYIPSGIEWALTFGSMALFGLMFAIFSKLFPMVSIWEVEEMEEFQGEVD